MAYEMVMPYHFLYHLFFRHLLNIPLQIIVFAFFGSQRTLLFEQEKKSTYIFLKPTIFMDKHILKYHHTDHLSPL